MVDTEMPHQRTDDIRIEQGDELLAPMQVMRELAPTERTEKTLTLIHISEPTRLRCISYGVFC
jgi:hypothetical protein